MKNLNERLLLSVLALMATQLYSCTGLNTANLDTKPVPVATAFFHDELFSSSDTIVIEPMPLLDLPDNYKQELDKLVLPLETEYERYRALREWVFSNFEDYEFDSTETYSLGELNTNRKINCLSFSAMFVAAARYSNIPAKFQLVFAPPYWDSENGTWINNQHIDVTGLVQRRSVEDSSFVKIQPFTYRYFSKSKDPRKSDSKISLRSYRYVVDINPAIVSIPLERQFIDDQQVLSLFYNNKSIEYLLDKDIATSYAYTKEALLTDPTSSASWNNLGVIYSRIEQLDFARDAFQMAIKMDDNAYSARSNLANVYQRQGEFEQASAMAASVEHFRKDNPYYHQALAETRLNEGDFDQAIAHLEEAVSRKHNEPYFYHELAIAYQKLGNNSEVIENLIKARRHSRGTERARFSGKLRALQDLVEARQGDIQ